ncbi:hypothetical protein GCM10010413_04640 [Promicromonospora sukumoe]
MAWLSHDEAPEMTPTPPRESEVTVASGKPPAGSRMLVDQSPADPVNGSQSAHPAVVSADADIVGMTAPNATSTAVASAPKPPGVRFTLDTL